MGVSGSGKTTVGKALASALGIPFYDADDFHPQDNIVKMDQGIPLQDLDRESWLETLSKNLTQWEAATGAVLACSALKEMYRTALNSGVNNDITWVYLYGRSELIKERMAGRRGHYFKPELLDSQLADLEPPQYGWHFNISSSADHIVKSILDKLRHTD
jgi:6-phosphogluconate dehydrogenase|tara:strand:- start:1449 stop:1925 length:477 start_codon:yes stop_codon:yes gene_type:complete